MGQGFDPMHEITDPFVKFEKELVGSQRFDGRVLGYCFVSVKAYFFGREMRSL